MYSNARVFGLGCAALVAICVTTLGVHLSAIDGRLLSASDMASVGGGRPPCTHTVGGRYCFVDFHCDEHTEQASCEAQDCAACTGGNMSSYCVPLPWGVSDCKEDDPDPDGCGKWILDDAWCEWTGDYCQCEGPPTELDCEQTFVTYDPDCQSQGS